MMINERSAKRIAEYLKNGGYFGNGKVHSISFSYENGMFKKVTDDLHEKVLIEKEFTYEEFISEIQNFDIHEFPKLTHII